MQNYDNNSAYDYRGKRGVVLLRVSTEEQEKKYGFPSQLRSIREKVIEPRGIRILDEEKYIVRDTYTGMEFRDSVGKPIKQQEQQSEIFLVEKVYLPSATERGEPRSLQ